MISASLAQIGEFSFILAELGVGLNLLPEAGPRPDPRRRYSVDRPQSADLRAGRSLEAGWKRTVKTAPRGQAGSRNRAAWLAPEERLRRQLTGHTILIGYGRVGSLVGQTLKEATLPFLVIEDADKTAGAARGRTASRPSRAMPPTPKSSPLTNPAAARRLILAIPNAFEAGQIVLRARAANPEIEHHRPRPFRCRGRASRPGSAPNAVIMGEREIARGIVEHMQLGSAEPKLADEDESEGPAKESAPA